MRCFRQCNGSGFRTTDREEAIGHMLREKNTCCRSNALHNDKERALSGALRLREVVALHLGEQDHHLY